MTLALCFNCGNIKFGAFNPCDECGYSPNNDMLRDASIGFSDWVLSDEEFRRYASVIKRIHALSDDDELCVWTFFRYISKNYPSILSIDVGNDIKIEADKILEAIESN